MCASCNSIRRGGDLLLVLTLVPSQPTDFKGEAKSETSVLLSWITPAQTGQENQITGYELMYRKRDDKEEVNSPTQTLIHFSHQSNDVSPKICVE